MKALLSLIRHCLEHPFVLEISALTEDQRPVEVTFRFNADLEEEV